MKNKKYNKNVKSCKKYQFVVNKKIELLILIYNV